MMQVILHKVQHILGAVKKYSRIYLPTTQRANLEMLNCTETAILKLYQTNHHTWLNQRI